MVYLLLQKYRLIANSVVVVKRISEDKVEQNQSPVSFRLQQQKNMLSLKRIRIR